MKTGRPAGVILAGGKSSRMGVERKALLELGGKTLLARVVDRLRGQLEPLLLSCENDTGDFDDFDLPVIPDLKPGHRGPLMGLCSALDYLEDSGHDTGLVLCPCDAPFIPGDLVQAMIDVCRSGEKPLVVVSYQGVLQPTFSLWQNHHLPVIRKSLFDKRMGGLKHLLMSLPHTVMEWAVDEPSPFFNVNTPEDLQAAELWLDRMKT
jgi:molybdopterin-guanine dinucleotide biosynthesis protein A